MKRIIGIFLVVLIVNSSGIFAEGLDFLKEYEFFGSNFFLITRYDFEEKKWNDNYSNEKRFTTSITYSLIAEGFAVHYWGNADSSKSGVGYYDQNFNLKKWMPNTIICDEVTYDGSKTKYENEWWEIGPNPEKVKFMEWGGRSIFLRDSRHILYKTKENETWVYDTKTRTQKLIAKGITPTIGEPAYHHPWILCYDDKAVYIFNYETVELKKIIEVKTPQFWDFQQVYYLPNGNPRLLGGPLLWREDDKGFVFGKYKHPFFLDPLILLSPLFYRRADAFYYDLETGQEYDMEVVLRSGQWRKKPKPDLKDH